MADNGRRSIVSTLQQTRKQLNAVTFDASHHLEGHISTISIDASDPEKRLSALFDKLTKQFTDLSYEIENDVSTLQNAARQTERILLNEIQFNAEKLLEVGNAVDGVKLSFDMASEGAVRIGGKLASAERERSHIDKTLELLAYLKVFQDTPTSYYNDAVKLSTTAAELREVLPEGLQKKNWGTISEALHDLKKILYEIHSDDIKNAQNNIGRVTDRVEMELLQEFEKVIYKLIVENQDDPRVVSRAKELAEWLHLFNFGQSIQKRYIFSVVQHRIPNDSFFQSTAVLQDQARLRTRMTAALNDVKQQATESMGSWLFGSPRIPAAPTPSAAVAAARAAMANGVDFSDTESDGDSGGGVGESSHHMNNNDMGGAGGMDGMSLVDHLSGLFTMINNVCQEQFSIIRAVFPRHTVPKVTRMLIQRIFNDPAFGIQARVDAVLCPAPPLPPLSLPDYLDALVIVREKLSALYLLLLECCSHPSMRGMGSESAALKKAKIPTTLSKMSAASSGSNSASANGNGTRKEATGGLERYADVKGDNDDYNTYIDGEEEAEEILHSDAEIREFFDDLVSFSGFYFSTSLYLLV
jgi:hypothetical protein